MISLVNVTKSAVSCNLVRFTEEILNGKLHSLCSDCFPSSHVNLKVVKFSCPDSLRIVLAFIRTLLKMNANAFTVQDIDFIRTDNFEEIKSTISTPPFS